MYYFSIYARSFATLMDLYLSTGLSFLFILLTGQGNIKCLSFTWFKRIPVLFLSNVDKGNNRLHCDVQHKRSGLQFSVLYATIICMFHMPGYVKFRKFPIIYLLGICSAV